MAFRISNDEKTRTEQFVRVLFYYSIDHPILGKDSLRRLLDNHQVPDFERGEAELQYAATKLLKLFLKTGTTLNWSIIDEKCRELIERLDNTAVQRFLAWMETAYISPPATTSVLGRTNVLGSTNVSGAACQACVVNINQLQNGAGTLGEPFGACNVCSSFVCGFHGTRDHNVPQMICVECDPNLLCASAASTTGATLAQDNLPQNPVLLQMLSGYPRSWMPPEAWAFKSVSEFMERRPGYDRSILEEAIRRRREVRPMEGGLREIWEPMLKEEGREMLVLAVVLTKRLDIPSNRLRPIMQTLRDSIG
jgi:hypothetical protein